MHPDSQTHTTLPWLALILAAITAPALAQQAQPQQPDPAPRGQVLFERHEVPPADEAPAQPTPPDPRPGISSSQKPPRTLRRRVPESTPQTEQPLPEQPAAAEPVASSSTDDPQAAILITDADRAATAKTSMADRAATAITATKLDLHLDTHTGDTEARAQLTLRNTGTTPLAHLPLRISGALHWESARINGTSAPTTQYHLADDLDHTGVATELVLTPAQPLAPGESVTLDLFYAGTLASSGQRLLTLGAPPERALRTDWDTVSDTFTGLRGIGNVLWYPVAEPPALLRDGATVPLTVEQARNTNAAAPFHLGITVQYTGTRPEAAFFCGERKLLKPLVPNSPHENESGVVIAQWDRAALGAHTPSLFIAQASPQDVAGGMLRVVTDRPDAAASLGEAARLVKPMLSEWLGISGQKPLDVLDLAIPGASGFTDGALLVAPLTTAPAISLAPSMVGPLTAAWLPADVAAPWLRDGLPAFLQAVWAERTGGRTAALDGLAATRTRLTRVEQPTPSATSSSSSATQDDPAPATTSQPLATCTDPACSRAKAAYVLEMLRTMLGDAALQQAISGWRVADENKPGNTAEAETAAFESLLQQVAGKRDLHWFFQSWIDADHGLPDLSILTVAPRKVERNAPINYLPPKQAVGGPIGPEPVPKPGDPESVAPNAVTPGNKVAPAAGSWLVAVEVQNAGSADAEVPVTVRAGGLTNTLPLHVPAHGRATIRVPFEADPEEVLVNDGSVPEVRTSQHRRTLNALTR